MIKVLFLCTGNSCRSQMAEGFLKQYHKYEVHSAGTNPDKSTDANAIKVMKESGIDISNSVPKSVDLFLKEHFDYVITVCDDAKEKCPVFQGQVKNKIHIGFEDPKGKSLDFFRKIRDEIKDEIDYFVKNLERDT